MVHFKRHPQYLSKWLLFALLFFLFLLQACSKKGIIVPAVTDTPTGTYHTGKFVWFDLLTNDVEAVKTFYGELFGWKFENGADANSPYTLVKHNGKSIGGIVYWEPKQKNVNETQWISYLSVPDVDSATEFVKNNGGIIHREPRSLSNRGRYSVVADPQGAVLALLRSDTGDPVDKKPLEGEWVWNELFTSDDLAAVSFYHKLVGYEFEKTMVGKKRDYYVLSRNGKYYAGILKSPWEDVAPNWLPYVLVNNPKELVEKVKKLGGQVLFEPNEKVRNGSVAIIADPTGGALAIQKWPYEENRGETKQ